MIARGRVGKMYIVMSWQRFCILAWGVGFTLVLKVPHGAEYNESPMLAAQVQAGKLCLRCMSGCHRSRWWSIRWIRSGNTGALGTC